MSIGLHHLRYFVAVAEEGNVSRAADRLHIAQPSLSAQIKYLEDHLGTPLFRRHARGVELTRAGALFLVEARKSIQAADAAVAVARTASRGEIGRLRIGFIVGTQVEATSRILRTFRERYPAVELELAEHTFADPSAGLNGGKVDVAFVMPPFSHHGLSFEEIHRVPRVAVVSEAHPLARRATISVRELFDDPWHAAQTRPHHRLDRQVHPARGRRRGRRAGGRLGRRRLQPARRPLRAGDRYRTRHHRPRMALQCLEPADRTLSRDRSGTTRSVLNAIRSRPLVALRTAAGRAAGHYDRPRRWAAPGGPRVPGYRAGHVGDGDRRRRGRAVGGCWPPSGSTPNRSC